eukprot:GHRR01014776.1.p1 GENE.GHRR01014776.1~~GHRR01014776.1.p1  ORF type:complete len:305 (+),score=54.31 GHRR01014776.1:944-1858(+)
MLLLLHCLNGMLHLQQSGLKTKFLKMLYFAAGDCTSPSFVLSFVQLPVPHHYQPPGLLHCSFITMSCLLVFFCCWLAYLFQAAGHPASPIHGPNQWPCQVPGFTPILMDYIHHMQRLGAALLRGIAAGLGLPQQYFGGSLAGHEESYWVLRVIHYPPLQDKSLKQQHQAAAAGQEVGRQVQLSCGEHTDYGLLTLVNQDPHVCALQVKNALGQWVDAPPLPGTFVCNIGDMFQVLTNGQYKPTLHRVLNTDPSKSRVSVPFFYEPCYEAIVQPIPQFCRSAPAKYPAVRYGTHLESKVLTNFEM